MPLSLSTRIDSSITPHAISSRHPPRTLSRQQSDVHHATPTCHCTTRSCSYVATPNQILSQFVDGATTEIPSEGYPQYFGNRPNVCYGNGRRQTNQSPSGWDLGTFTPATNSSRSCQSEIISLSAPAFMRKALSQASCHTFYSIHGN